MDRDRFERIDSTDDFIARLKAHGLYREDDVTFEELEDGDCYVFVGDDFEVDADTLAEFEIVGLLIEGDLRIPLLSIADILDDFGVICVTGDIACTDLLYATESTGVVVGGSLLVERVFWAECGNSVLQVNGDLRAKVAFVRQCHVDVQGTEASDADESASLEALAAVGVDVSGHDEPDDAIEAHFDALLE